MYAVAHSLGPIKILGSKGGMAMPSYLIQFSYTPETLAAMIKKPGDRKAVISKLAEQVGGKLLGYWLCFGEHDGVVVIEGGDNIGAAACSAAVASSGAFKTFRTTPLLNPDEALQVLAKAGGIKYKPPGAKK